MKKTMIAALAFFFALGISLDVSAQSDSKPSKRDRSGAVVVNTTPVKASSSHAAGSLLEATNKSKSVATIQEADVVRRKPSKWQRSKMVRKDAME